MTQTDVLTSIYSSGSLQTIGTEAKLAGERIFFLAGPIDEEAARCMTVQLIDASRRSPEDITLFIQSPGGSIEAGMVICDVMNLVEPDVRTVALGTAASMGAVIFAAGTKGKRFMLPSSRLMIHEPLYTRTEPTSTSDAIRLGEMMTDIKRRMSTILADATGQPVEKIEEDTKTDKFFTAEEAVAYGLADGIFEPKNFADFLNTL